MDTSVPLHANVFLQSGLAVIFAVMFVPKSGPVGLATKPLTLVKVVASTLVTTTSVTFLPHLVTVSYSSGSPGPFRGGRGASWTITS